MQIKYSLGHASPKLVEDAFDLRQQVFTHEQGFPADIDVDEYDDTALHVVLYLNQHPAAVLRCILFEETGLVKVVVLRYKNSIEEKGYTMNFMKFVEHYAQQHHFKKYTFCTTYCHRVLSLFKVPNRGGNIR